MEKTLKQVTTYIVDGREFCICYTSMGEQRGFWGFENGVTIVDGVIVKEVNGVAGFHSKKLADCLERIRMTVNYETYKSEGIDPSVAFLMACGGLTREEAEEAARNPA